MTASDAGAVGGSPEGYPQTALQVVELARESRRDASVRPWVGQSSGQRKGTCISSTVRTLSPPRRLADGGATPPSVVRRAGQDFDPLASEVDSFRHLSRRTGINQVSGPRSPDVFCFFTVVRCQRRSMPPRPEV